MMQTPEIKRIEWISMDAQEAIVWLSDGVYHVGAFAQPYHGQAGESLKLPLLAYDTSSLMVVEESEPLAAVKDDRPLGYHLVAKILSVTPALLALGAILIEPDLPLPGDSKAGDRISFSCARLDFQG